MSNTVSSNPFQFMSLSELEQNDVQSKEKFKSAMKDGYFYLEMPKKCSELINSGEKFAREFFKNKEIKEYQSLPFGGYVDRKDFQVESFISNKNDWNLLEEKGLFSREVVELGKEMDSLALKILTRALAVLNVPNDCWNEYTGGLTGGNGQHHLTFNHYRSKLTREGFPSHKDFGLVTVLYVDSVGGLEGKIGNDFVNVKKVDNYFIVNFGKYMEKLLEGYGEVKAIEHRVRKTPNERISFGIFLDGDNHLPPYLFNKEKGVVEKVNSTFEKFIKGDFDLLFDK